MSKNRELYLKTTGLKPANKKAIRKAALDRAHDIRQFEIDLYWKRANYFWLLQAAVFAAVGLTWKSDSSFPAILPIGLSALGLVTSFAGWLATKGSRFWQRNWEHQIDMLEAEFEGNLYKTVYVGPDGVGWSLTGVSERLALCFVLFWLLAVIGLSAFVNHWDGHPGHVSLAAFDTLDGMTLLCWVLCAVGCYLIQSASTGISGEVYDYPESFSTQKSETVRPALRGEKKRRRLLRREPNI